MMQDTKTRLCLTGAGALLAIVLVAGTTFAQPPAAPAPGHSGQTPKSELIELRNRIEKLEQMNAQLLQMLQNGSAAAAVGAGVSGGVTEEGVNKIVTEAIQKNEADQRNKQEEAKRLTEYQKLQDDAQGFKVGHDLGMTVKWRHGLYAETRDKAFKVHVGGRTQFDTVWMTANDNVMFGPGGTGPIDDGFNFRRGRLEVDGSLYEVIDFWMEWDFINTGDVDTLDPPKRSDVQNTPVPTDLWMQISHIPWIGHVRVGNQKPQLSLEHLTSSRFLPFLERSLAFDVYNGGLENGFKPGVQIWNYTENERMTWSIGFFKNNQRIFGWNTGDGEYDVTGRVTWLPMYKANGRCLLHLGLGASHRDTDDGLKRLRARTLLRNGPAPLHTRLLDLRLTADSESLIVPELLLILGPWTFQAEYFATWTQDARPVATPGAVPVTHYSQSAYVQALYFLTGETQPYNLHGGSGAAPTRVIPYSNYFFVPGHSGHIFSGGAWQVGARYSWVDLRDNGIDGGIAQDLTLGLNWFLNPNIKFQWNYSLGHRDVAGDGSDGYVQGFGMRMAMDF